MHIIHEEIGFPKITSQKQGDHSVVFTMSPLPSGFGMTVGNALRRVLLSSVPGAAITACKIEGVSHEYTSIEGVRDSALDILLNLKRLPVLSHSKEPIVATLNAKGEGEVKASDIKVTSEVEILDPDYVITHLDKKTSTLNMELRIEKGVGYVPAQERQKEEKEAGWILIDSIFSPVKKVKYDVSSVRVGQMTNLDKLEIEVETNGSIEPDEAMRFSAKIVEKYFALFQKDEKDFENHDFISDFDAKKSVSEEEQSDDAKETYTPIEVLNFSPRTLNALINGDIGSVEELVQCTEAKLDTLRGFGKKAMNEVAEKLAERGLRLTDQ
ncbi:MAG: DNA-directed RNA polymerase subunit alpha [Candidatus Gracilibacteria bacterium]|jgi:DNA-directed RNA polymerase subunit alpha|nr:DNA-directed RNA polymerase subunit alpha [Candidatus Gracilibacteria bacterium]